MTLGRIEALADRGRVLTCEDLYEGCFNSDEPPVGSVAGAFSVLWHGRLRRLGAYGGDAVSRPGRPRSCRRGERVALHDR